MLFFVVEKETGRMGIYGQIRERLMYLNQMNIEPINKQVMVNGKKVNILFRYQGINFRKHSFIQQEFCSLLSYRYDGLWSTLPSPETLVAT